MWPTYYVVIGSLGWVNSATLSEKDSNIKNIINLNLKNTYVYTRIVRTTSTVRLILHVYVHHKAQDTCSYVQWWPLNNNKGTDNKNNNQLF